MGDQLPRLTARDWLTTAWAALTYPWRYHLACLLGAVAVAATVPHDEVSYARALAILGGCALVVSTVFLLSAVRIARAQYRRRLAWEANARRMIDAHNSAVATELERAVSEDDRRNSN